MRALGERMKNKRKSSLFLNLIFDRKIQYFINETVRFISRYRSDKLLTINHGNKNWTLKRPNHGKRYSRSQFEPINIEILSKISIIVASSSA